MTLGRLFKIKIPQSHQPTEIYRALDCSPAIIPSDLVAMTLENLAESTPLAMLTVDGIFLSEDRTGCIYHQHQTLHHSLQIVNRQRLVLRILGAFVLPTYRMFNISRACA